VLYSEEAHKLLVTLLLGVGIQNLFVICVFYIQHGSKGLLNFEDRF
jgi:hypothetical protein